MVLFDITDIEGLPPLSHHVHDLSGVIHCT